MLHFVIQEKKKNPFFVEMLNKKKHTTLLTEIEEQNISIRELI